MRILFFVTACALLLSAGCDSLLNPATSDLDTINDAPDSDTVEHPTLLYRIDTASVDYKGDNNVVYYHFSTGTKTVVAHDAWHLAFDNDMHVIANSGNYGWGVAVCSTGTTDFGADFTSWFTDTTKIFTRIDTNANVLGQNWMDFSGGMPPSYTNQVYLLKTKGEKHYKVQFTGAGMDGTVSMKIGDPSDAAADELSFTHDNDYEYTFIDCESRQAVIVAPKKDSWDIRFGRTEFAMGKRTGGRSTIAINAAGGVRVAVVEGKNIDEVTDAAALSYEADMLAIGHSWYDFDHDTKVYSVAQKVYVFNTTENVYAKCQIASFDGPDGESFWCRFQYLYQHDGSDAFSK